MGGKFSFWGAALGLLCSLTAQADSPVWAIRGANNTVFLAGSVHLLKPEHSALPASFDRAYAEAEALVMELDLDDFDPLEAQSWMLQHGMFSGETTLRQAIGEKRFQRVAAEAQRLGLPIEGLQKIEPWAIALSLMELQYAQLGYDPQLGVERQLEQRARRDGKEIRGLETLDDQLGKLDALSYELQGRFLELTVEEMHDVERQTDDLLAAWRDGDSARLAALLTTEFDEFPELYRILVTDRNRRWMPQIEQLLKDKQDYLVVVGALHLVGKEGLVELAQGRGLKPSRVK
jgi:uncharacterized protein YbaP (TraB family)